ncbi:copper resistance protein CopD [Pseudomonas psychrophila]|uniref:copper homeostasis membrane protein CopD n=1 Tax=Pseudomonas psychrophila TaxID=122355 RepID=UPI00062A49C3|nr:copper homeostasis membrane protein CopD [Pseudomonas psychrophila]KOX66359.1 copper resistance protein CopD [Pseudomonas psychrophila]
MVSAMVICRFVHFCVVLLMFGACAFRPLLLGAWPCVEIDRQLRKVNRVLAWVGLGSGVAWLVLTTHSMAGSWPETLDLGTLWLVLGSTFFGQVWAFHLLFCVLLLITLYAPARFYVIWLLSFLLLATLAPVGHGAMLDGWRGQLLMLNQLIHLVCVAIWLGGLMGLLLILGRPAGHAVSAVLQRFSNLGFVLVAGIMLTGLINTRVLTGALWPTPLFEGFALILLIKVTLVGVMLLLALLNLVMSRLGRIALLRSSVALEWFFGLAAVAAVSLLGTLPPLVVG